MGELQNARREAEQLRPALSEAQSLVAARDAALEGLRGQLDVAQGKAAELAAKEDELRTAKASHEEQLVFVSLQLENAKRSEVRARAAARGTLLALSPSRSEQLPRPRSRHVPTAVAGVRPPSDRTRRALRSRVRIA